MGVGGGGRGVGGGGCDAVGGGSCRGGVYVVFDGDACGDRGCNSAANSRCLSDFVWVQFL